MPVRLSIDLTCSIGTRCHWDTLWGVIPINSASALTLPALSTANLMGSGLMPYEGHTFRLNASYSFNDIVDFRQ